jgi:hypothetical protein
MTTEQKEEKSGKGGEKGEEKGKSKGRPPENWLDGRPDNQGSEVVFEPVLCLWALGLGTRADLKD